MNEKPLERLNYYNGQRLEARDLKLEQEYHIRVRRWLNKALYTSGIARGLEVRPEKNEKGENTLRVIVSTGLAMVDGLEIILLEEERVTVPGKSSGTSEAEVEGLYLTIQYHEETVAEEQDGCAVRPVCRDKDVNQMAWGGPARIRAKPILCWCDHIPHESSGKIVLAQVELEKGCKKVHQINTGVRRYVGAASAAKVHQYALEGQRDIDPNNPQRIYFHIRGRQPNAVTLYLRAEKFSTLYYTEMGQHKHTLNVTAGVETGPPILHPDTKNPDKYKHSHPISDRPCEDGVHTNHKLMITFAGAHGYTTGRRLVVTDWTGLLSGMALPLGMGEPVYDDILPVLSDPNRIVSGNTVPFEAMIDNGSHVHKITFEITKVSVYDDPTTDDHTHRVPEVSMENAGVTDIKARNGQNEMALTYFTDLLVFIDGKDKTKDILNQLKNMRPPQGDWSILGDGTATHPLADKGTGPIKLDFLPLVSFDEGEHYIEFQVKSGGGRIHYNLYVE